MESIAHCLREAGPLEALAAELGLSAASLRRIGAGWVGADALAMVETTCRGPGCWAFPMHSSDGRVVGIRLRSPSGFKYAVAGGAEGLFLPRDLSSAAQLLVAEGPTDTAALLDLGFAAIGRPSCSGGMRQTASLVGRLHCNSIVIVSDNDEPGLRGAAVLGAVLRPHVADVRVIRPPGGIKDARAWRLSVADPGAVRSAILDAIDAAIPAHVSVARLRTGGRS
jgi:hypothetical protein